MSTYTKLALAITNCGIEPRSVRRHLPLIEAAAEVMNGHKPKVHQGQENFSLTFDEGEKRVRLIFSKYSPASMVYCYLHEHRDEYKAIAAGERPTAELVKKKLEWLNCGNDVRHNTRFLPPSVSQVEFESRKGSRGRERKFGGLTERLNTKSA